MNRPAVDHPSTSLFSQAVRAGRSHLHIVRALRMLFVILLIGGMAIWRHNASADVVPGMDAANSRARAQYGFQQTTTVSPQTAALSATTTVTTAILATKTALVSGIVDIEVYNSADQKVGQQYFVGQNIAVNQTLTHSYAWATSAAGSYRVAVGVFGPNWTPSYLWVSNAASFTINSPAPTATSTNTVDPPSSTNTPVPATATSTKTPAPPTATNTVVPPSNTPIPASSTNTPAPPSATATAVSTKTSTPTPASPTGTSTPNPPPSSFVYVCGTSYCMNGQPFTIKSATGYGTYSNPSAEVAEAQAGHINTIELVEFDTQYHALSDTESSATWTRVDTFIATARRAGMHVILHLAEYGQSLQAAGYNMSSTATGTTWPNLGWQGDWNQYLNFIANRVNTVTGIMYKNDPTIAMIQVWGEIPAPASTGAVGTTSQLDAFFANTFQAWRATGSPILIASGGMSYLDWNSGIDWQTIMSDSNNAACEVEINSYGDRNTTVPMVTQYCKGKAKPWFLAAWSSCSKSSQGSWDIDDQQQSTVSATDTSMAAHASDMYNIAKGGAPAYYPALGNSFWNLGTQTWNTCDLGPASPESPSQTWSVVQNN